MKLDDGTGRKKCSEDFPKHYNLTTFVNEDSYPEYRRRPSHGGQVATKMVNGEPFDNRWVVPYNPFLSLKHKCHLNVEVIHR